MSRESQLLALGFPEAGKTTFLAALWHLAESEEIAEALCLERLPADAEYLNGIKNGWIRCQKVKPTIPGKEEFPSLWLRDRGGGPIGQVHFPDLSGEFFKRAWVNRRWSSQYDKIVAASNSILLFINPSKVRDPHTIADVAKIGKAVLDAGEGLVSEQTTPSITESPAAAVEKWEPEKAATQVQLVELLQYVDWRMHTGRPIRIAVVISAWDLVAQRKTGGITPDLYLERRLALVDQFLKSNFERFQARVYGISAQGGELPDDYTRLMKYEHASERIRVDGPNCAKHDITEPLRWGLSLRDSAGTP